MNLACPACTGSLELDGGGAACDSCGRRFEAVDGLLVLDLETESDQHAHQRRYFDDEFSGYSEYTVENWRRSFLDRIFAALAIPREDGPYLDVGVGGSGATVIETARLGMSAAGCDLSVPGLLRARAFAEQEGVAERTTFVACAAERLPFANETFAVASAVALLEHLDDDTVAIRELKRVLRPGGLVWITVPHAFRYMPPPVWPLYWWHDRRIGHKRHYTSGQLVERFASAGFAQVSTSYSAHPIKLLQYAFERALPASPVTKSRLWWRLERLDRRARSRAWGALHLSAVFRKL